MQLFIDTNIFLSFYHLTSEDLIELEKLAVLIENKEINLLVTEQVIDETKRNRDSKIKDGLTRFRKADFKITFPAYCKAYPEYEKIRKNQDESERLHAQLIKTISEDVKANRLKADMLLDRLFSIAEVIPRTNEIVEAAERRVKLGNPPGKDNSLGDAINWESLLAREPGIFSLHLVSDDQDFYSPLQENQLNRFLDNEWKERRLASISYYRQISRFFSAHFPDINLETERLKDELIQKLAASPNFATTHSLISELSTFDNFTLKQLEELVAAASFNSQVNWIISDEDVNSFYSKLLESDSLTFTTTYYALCELLDAEEVIAGDTEENVDSSDDVIPF